MGRLGGERFQIWSGRSRVRQESVITARYNATSRALRTGTAAALGGRGLPKAAKLLEMGKLDALKNASKDHIARFGRALWTLGRKLRKRPQNGFRGAA